MANFFNETKKFFLCVAGATLIVSIVSFSITLLVNPKLESGTETDSYVSSNWYPGVYYAFICLTIIISCGLYFLHKWLSDRFFEDKPPYFYTRARRFEKKANMVLWLIFVLIIGGSVVFFKASYFASDDASTLGSITNSILKADGEARSNETSTSNSLSSNKDSQTSTKSSPQKGISLDAEAALKTNQPSLPAWLPLAFVLTLRVGDIAITSFLTIMCLRIYRYNLRLSSFYFARGDILQIKGGDAFVDTNPELLSVLLDANFDFGTDVDPLSKHLADIISALNLTKKAKQENGDKSDG